MDTNSETAVDVAAFRREAARLFSSEIRERWARSRNVWRTAWALDTILDYFRVCGVDGAALGGDALNALNPTYLGNWWDDFGWIGIAALRAAEQNAFPVQGDAFVKIAINAWAYMYGPGWSARSQAVYPFQGVELPGWAEFAASHSSNIGASRVWKEIRRTWPNVTAEQVAQREPRYGPGGAWNSPFVDAVHPHLVPSYQGDGSYLNPIQNTVTNGLYAILALRIYQASQNPRYKHVFAESTLDTVACLQAWKDQIHWLNHWMIDAPAEESLLLDLGMGNLVRERVSTFHEWQGQRYWDAAYRRDLAWTGDQGLLLGALREGVASGYLDPLPPVLGQYVNIVIGTFKNGFAPRRYGQVQGVSLLPWIVAGSTDPFSRNFPQGDNPDYQTGTGVFMRYFLQAYQAEPVRWQKYAEQVLSSATQLVYSTSGAPNPDGPCDAFTPYSNDDLGQLTASVNRLSVMLLAIEMGRVPNLPLADKSAEVEGSK